MALLPSLPTPSQCTSQMPPGRGNLQSGEWSGLSSCPRITISGRCLDLDLDAKTHHPSGPPLLLSDRPIGVEGNSLIGTEYIQPSTRSAGEHLAITQQIIHGELTLCQSQFKAGDTLWNLWFKIKCEVQKSKEVTIFCK